MLNSRYPIPTARLVLAALVALLAAPAAAQPTHISLKLEKKLNAGLAAAPAGLDRSTPMRAWSALLGYCGSHKWDLAPHLFNLGDIREGDQRALGASVAQKLCQVLAKVGTAGPEGLDDTQIGPLTDDKPTNYVVAASFKGPHGKTQQVWLRRVRDESASAEVWVVTRKTVSLIPGWHRALVRGETVVEAVDLVNAGLGRIPDSYQVKTPRAVANLFRKLTVAGSYADAARLLDLQGIEPRQQKEAGPRLARRLALVLERVHAGGFGRVSNDPQGAPEKDVPEDEEVIARGTLADKPVELHLVRRQRKQGGAVWVFAPSTVEEVDRLYKMLGYGWAGDMLPPMFFNVQFVSVQLWQWIGLVLGIVVSLIFGYLLSFITRKVLLRAARLTKWDWDDRVVEATRGPFALAYFALGMLIVAGLLSLTAGPQRVVLKICELLVILGMGWLLVRAVDVAGEVLHDFFRKRDDEMGMAMIPVARKIFKPIMVVVVLIVALQNAGMNVAGLLAGLGIGGLALAMASKTTVENMLGGITIAFDRPFKVGDFIKLGDLTGTVEEVGLRSTRVRTLDRTVVTIPNGQMVDSKVENFAPRDRIRLSLTFGVQYDSTIDQVRLIVDEVKRAILRHPKMFDDFRVRFSAFGDSSLDMEIYSFVATTDFNEFTAVKEQILIEIGEIVTAAGAEFAFPSRTVYMGKASDADAKKAKLAAKTVEERITAGDWTIPEIPDEIRQKLRP